MIVPDSGNPAPLTRFAATLANFEKKAGVRQSLSVAPTNQLAPKAGVRQSLSVHPISEWFRGGLVFEADKLFLVSLSLWLKDLLGPVPRVKKSTPPPYKLRSV